MRSFLLMGFIACIFFHFYSRKGKVESVSSHDDSLQTTQSSIKRMPVAKATTVPRTLDLAESRTEVGRAPESESPDEAYDEYAEAEPELNIPWNEIEEGWKTELRSYLMSADPENADEIYSAYIEEKKKFAERIDVSESNLNSQGPSFDETGSGQDMEKNHQQNLKELFGDHYAEIQALHREYVESIQYINRSDVPFSISL